MFINKEQKEQLVEKYNELTNTIKAMNMNTPNIKMTIYGKIKGEIRLYINKNGTIHAGDKDTRYHLVVEKEEYLNEYDFVIDILANKQQILNEVARTKKELNDYLDSVLY